VTFTCITKINFNKFKGLARMPLKIKILKTNSLNCQ